MMKYRVTYYRTLVREVWMDEECIEDTKRQAESHVTVMANADFDLIHEERAEIVLDGTTLEPAIVTTICPQ